MRDRRRCKQELFGELAWASLTVEDSTVNVRGVSNLRLKLETGHRRYLLPNRVGHGLQTAQCLIDVGGLFLTFHTQLCY